MRAARLVAGCLLAVMMMAATEAQQSRTFDVVSIKRNTSGEVGGRIGVQPGGRFMMVNMEIRSLIGSAYPTDTSEFVNAPSWIFTEKYDISATAPPNTSRADMEPMFRALLAERFKFKGHYETREHPVYELVLARADRTLPAAVKTLDIDCDARRAASLRGEKLPELAALQNGMPPCSMSMSGTQLISNGMTMASFARSIQGSTGRVVVDKTGLTGHYAFTFNYTSAQRLDSDIPSVFTALEEQLGLKLQSSRGPVRVLVIDAIERPTEN
jgi:uncharacterized protein (TIGR03435 family)